MDEEEEERSAAGSRLSILNDLERLSGRVKALLDANEAEPADARLAVAAFDPDREARERGLAAARFQGERLRRCLEERIGRQNRACARLRDRFSEPLLVQPRNVFSMFGESKVANYPLLEEGRSEARHRARCRFSAEARELASGFEEEEEEAAADDSTRDERAARAASTAALRDLLGPTRGYVDVLEACAAAEIRERDSKIRFNERVERMRVAKASETRAARERAKETRRCVDELRRTFRVDASSKLLNAPRLREVETAKDDGGDGDDGPSESASDAASAVADEERAQDERKVVSEADEEEFRRATLERMMDGVLELGLKERAKRSVPGVDRLEGKDPSEEDVLAMETRERTVREIEADRRKYRSVLESEIERIAGEFRSGVRAFDEKLNDLATEKARTERSVLLERFGKVRAIVAHRRTVRGRSEVRDAIEPELAAANEEARRLGEECELFEAGVAELRNRYESVRKRDKLLEGKFRGEFAAETKPAVLEHLFRRYRRRPRAAMSAACGTSVAFLTELADRVIDARTSDILPREWLDRLRAVANLEAMPTPDSLPFRLDPDHWHRLCRLRRLKLEAETKVRSCAVELAEAEQSLAFCRRACAAANERAEAARRCGDSFTEPPANREVRLLLKTGQLEEQPRGSLRTDWRDAVLIPRAELDRLNEATAEAGARKSAESRRLLDLERIIRREEWRHARAKMLADDLKERSKELEAIKVSRAMSERPGRHPNGDVEERFRALQEIFLAAVEKERRKLRGIAREAEIWRLGNAKSIERIRSSRAEKEELVAGTGDSLRSNGIQAFRRKRVRAIARKARLARKVRENVDELLALESRLEILKLRTYPTLRFQF